jgi:hypothetical protein
MHIDLRGVAQAWREPLLSTNPLVWAGRLQVQALPPHCFTRPAYRRLKMPRPLPPPPLAIPTISPFNIGEQQKRDLAKVLGLRSLPPQISNGIEHAIACYKAIEAGSPDTTVRNTIAALDELKRKDSAAYQRAVARLANDQSGVDYTTHGVLQPLAKAVLKEELGAKDALAQASCARAEELRGHERVETAIEPLRFFCGVLRIIFNHAAAPELRSTDKESWRRCRQFALEVFTIADMDHADFDAHPKRLTKYLGTDMGGIAP